MSESSSAKSIFFRERLTEETAEHQSRPCTWQPTQAASRPKPPDTLFSRSEQAKARAAAHANNDPHRSLRACSALFCSLEVRFSPALWRVVSRRRRPPATSPARTTNFALGQVSQTPDKSVLSVSVQREMPLRPAGSLSQELCHHPSTRTQGWCRQPTERCHGGIPSTTISNRRASLTAPGGPNRQPTHWWTPCRLPLGIFVQRHSRPQTLEASEQ